MDKTLLLVSLLCFSLASNADDFQDGVAHFNLGNYEQAIAYFDSCKNIHTSCMHNIGISHLRLKQKAEAQEWLTLAARYGSKNSIATLKANNWPVPQADLTHLIVKNNATDDTVTVLDVANELLKSYNKGMERRNQALKEELDKSKNCHVMSVGNNNYDVTCY